MAQGTVLKALYCFPVCSIVCSVCLYLLVSLAFVRHFSSLPVYRLLLGVFFDVICDIGVDFCLLEANGPTKN